MILEVKKKKSQGQKSLHHCLSALTTEAETLTESVSEPEVATRQELQEEEEQTKPPRSAPKTLSSFFSEFSLLTPPPGVVQAGGWWACLQRPEML